MIYNKPRLFLVSLLALCTAGISFAIRSSVASDMQAIFFDPIDKLRSAEMIGAVLGVAFLGFAFTIAIGSPLLDYLGMGNLLALSSLCFMTGTVIVINAGSLAPNRNGYRQRLEVSRKLLNLVVCVGAIFNRTQRSGSSRC